MVERRLGRGLDFFLSSQSANTSGEEIQHLEVGSVAPSPHQPRREFEESELQALAASVRSNGILQPILVRKVKDRFELIAGERRWRAAKLAGLERIPALVREMTDQQVAVASLVENLQRTDLGAIEKARAFQKLQAAVKGSAEEVGRQVGLDRTTVTNFIRLLELPEEVQAHVSRGTLTMGHARAILGLRNADEQIRVAEECLRKKLSVRQVEELVQGVNAAVPLEAGPAKVERKERGRPVWVDELEANLGQALNAKVHVRYGRKRSKILIETGPREDFERIYEALKSLGKDLES